MKENCFEWEAVNETRKSAPLNSIRLEAIFCFTTRGASRVERCRFTCAYPTASSGGRAYETRAGPCNTRGYPSSSRPNQPQLYELAFRSTLSGIESEHLHISWRPLFPFTALKPTFAEGPYLLVRDVLLVYDSRRE